MIRRTATSGTFARRRALAGGKAASLETARAAGLAVPPFLVLTPPQVRSLEAHASTRARLAREAELLGGEALAIRSSGVAEDGDVSYAGQLETIVGVRGADALFDAVRLVAASGDSARLAHYGRRVGSTLGEVSVIVQRHIETHWAGVAFCRDPITFQPEIVVEAVRGAGELLVGGSTTPARYVLSRDTLEPLAAPESHEPSPPADVVREAARLALRAEELFGTPQDIEWGWDGETLWLLQSRPLTSLAGLEVYSDTFSAEVWPGLIKPLVFDVGDVAVNRAWGRMLTAIAGPVDVDWRRMAGIAASRAYFNDSLLGDVLSRAGLPENTLEAIEHGERPRLRGGSYVRMARSALRLASYLLRNARWLGILGRKTPAIRERAVHLTRGADGLDASETASRIRSLLEVLEEAAYYSALTMIAMGLHGASARALARIVGSKANVHELAGDAGEDPLGDLECVAAHVRRLSATETEVVARGDSDEIAARLGASEPGSAAIAAMEHLLARWGHVAAVNTDFSSSTWHDDPGLLWRMAACARAISPTAAWEERRRALPWLLRGQVDQLRRYVAARDSVNDILALSYDGLRQVSRRAGHLLTGTVLSSADDVYYLHLDELLTALEGDRAWQQARVAERRAMLLADADGTPPHRLWGLRLPPRWRMQGAKSAIALSGQLSGIAASAGTFVGVARIVTDLSAVPALRPGDVLVVPHADVGWTPLFGAVGAVVTSTGGGLSHAAIVARELAVPAVLSVPDATLVIPEGARVFVDGTEGIVRLLAEPVDAPSTSQEASSCAW